MRVEDLGGSKSLELVNLVFDKLSKGEKVISLAIGEPLQDTDKEIIDYATKAMFEGYTHYVPTPGIPEFRKSAAEKVNRKNSIKADVENVIFVPSKFAIYSALMAIGMNSSMEVLVPDPGYFYEEPVMLSGMKPVRYKLNADFSLNINEISSKINKSTRALIINDPGNPTGRIFKESELKMVYDLCLKHNIFIISDEAYEDIILVHATFQWFSG
ncbi:MAG: pyridoxal phosphate-dependent aminotransferase [Thermoplasmataceae archaeon]